MGVLVGVSVTVGVLVGVCVTVGVLVGVVVLVGEGVVVGDGVGVGVVLIHTAKQNPPCGDTRPGPPDILTGVF